jgi:hypothetical protein
MPAAVSHRADTAPFTLSEGDAAAGGHRHSAVHPRGGAEVVVVMFGWVGAQDKHLAKYAHAWHAAGVRTVLRHTVSTLDGYMRPAVLDATARRMFAVLDAHYHGASVVVQYFSNGGAWMHPHVARVWAERVAAAAAAVKAVRGVTGAPAPVSLGGLVFDSCPAYMHLSVGARAPVETIANPILRWLAWLVLFVVLNVLVLFDNRPQRFWQQLEDDATAGPASAPAPAPHTNIAAVVSASAEPAIVPALYLYSRSDHLTDATKLDGLVATRRARVLAAGVTPERASKLVRAVTWDRSPHVGHLRKHPEAYHGALVSLLELVAARD